MANIAYQYRLYPDPEQATFFVRTFGCCRKVWNLMLSDKIEYLVRVEKHFPSSQLCSCCGYKNPVTKDLSIRKIRCPKCGTEYDRDINAAINIDREGVRLLTCLTVSHT